MKSFFKLDREKSLNYVESLRIISSLSKLFSENSIPFLHYRAMENLFCQCFQAENLSRSDTAYDAKIGNLGIGLKTFICNKKASIEKVAEFNKDSQILKTKVNIELAKTLAILRNERIQLANDLYGITNSIYHIIARDTNRLIFFETDYEKINIDNIRDIKDTKASLSFYDGVNEYYFNRSKSVLQRKFYIPQKFSSVDIKILENPFEFLLLLKDNLLEANVIEPKIAGVDYVILPLYSTKSKEKNVSEKSGLNQWNAGGRKRKYGEVYIPVPTKIHQLCPNFFPFRDIPFTLRTPLNENLQVKLCQDNSKALMSNPNDDLANWLLKKALRLREGEIATYEKMQNLGFDCVIIEKKENGIYNIDIRPLDSYEKFINDFEKNL